MTQPERIRLAVVLRRYWLMSQQHQVDTVVPISAIIAPYLQRLRRAEQHLALAHDHHLSLIEPSLQEAVLFQARSLRITLQDQEGLQFPIRHELSLRDFYQDLLQLEQEFPEVVVNWKTSELIVETEAITLSEVKLGAFTIRLNWDQWGRHRDLTCLQVMAQDPNTPELNQEVTHPHVRDNELCTGDAQVPLQHALETGRLAEFFLLARAVLTTYNPHSAYVRLEEWQGVPCYDCGDIVEPDDRSYCEDCQHDFCTSCSSSCNCCDTTRCLSCLLTCSACGESSCRDCVETSGVSDQLVCRDCREACPGCQIHVAPGELHAESGLCPDCHLHAQEEITHDAVTTSTS